jgi:hypothetical protein
MQKADFFSGLDQIRKDTEKRASFDMKVLQVRRPYPKGPLHRRREREDLPVMVCICDIFQHRGEKIFKDKYSPKRAFCKRQNREWNTGMINIFIHKSSKDAEKVRFFESFPISLKPLSD